MKDRRGLARRGIVIGALCSLVFGVLFCSGTAFAGGWGYTPGGPGSGNCSEGEPWYLYDPDGSKVCSDSGLAWAYYKITSNYKTWMGDIRVGHRNVHAGEPGSARVPSSCADVGGFYRFGYVATKWGIDDGTTGDGWGPINNYHTYTKYGLSGNTSRDLSSGVLYSLEAYFHTRWNSATGSWDKMYYGPGWEDIYQRVYYGSGYGTLVAYGDHFAKNEEASAAFDVAEAAEVTQSGQTFDGASTFCYSDSLLEKEAHFSATTTATVNGTSVGSNNDYYLETDNPDTNLVFTHTITRGNGDTGSIREYYNGEYSGNSSGTFFDDSSWDSTKKGETHTKTHSKTITLRPGAQFTYCENVYYESYVKQRGSTRTVEHARSTKKCITVKRRPVPCAFNTDNQLGVTGGRNDATASIYNRLTGQSASAGAGDTATVFARPGDSIQFGFEMCAVTAVAGEGANTNFTISSDTAASIFADSLVGLADSDYNTKTSKSYIAGDFNNANGYHLSITSPSDNTSPSAPLISDGIYRLRSKVGNGSYVLDNLENKKVNGNNVAIYTAASASAMQDSQRWQFIFDKTTGYYRIQNANSNFSLDVAGASIENRANVQIYQNNTSCAQRWRVSKNADGSYRIQNACSNKSLDVNGGVGANGTNVQIWSNNESNAQKWVFERLSDSPGGSTTYSSATYTCPVYGSGISFTPYSYQVPGLTVSDSRCNTPKGKAAKNYSDVGKTLQESVAWNNDSVNANGSISFGGTATARAEAKVPYNYLARPFATLSGAGSTSSTVVYAGSNLVASAGVAITARTNSAIANSSYNNYATHSKTSKVRVWSFYSTSGYKHSGDSYTTVDLSSSVATSYLRTNFGAYGTVSQYSADNLTLNSRGRLAGNGNDSSSLQDGGSSIVRPGGDGNFTFSVPQNVTLGTKACFVVAVYPADSHNDPAATSVFGAGNADIAMQNTGNSWAVSAPVCKTVAKKPTFSVEGSNAFSSGPIHTAITDKYIGSTNFRFGSWSEYGVYGAVSVSSGLGMASGAAFGYQTGNAGTSLNANRSNTADNTVSTTGNTTICTYSTQTFANSDCATNHGTVGIAGLNNNAVKAFKTRIEQHFTAGDADEIDQKYVNNLVSPYICDTVGTELYASGGRVYRRIRENVTCIKTNNGTRYLNAMNRNIMNSQADSNGITHVKFSGNGYYGNGVSSTIVYVGGRPVDIYLSLMSLENIDNDSKNWTNVDEYIEDSSGRGGVVVIDTDMVQGTANNDTDPALSNVSQLSKQIIVAKKVYFTARVKRVDAMIIADEVNTCAYASYDDFIANRPTTSGTTDTSSGTPLSSNNCNTNITFNAPVLTRKLILNRTGGNDASEASITRGEIFNLRMDTYLWSYAQMQRYSQAVITYSRELPTRY